jgi:hypothetical protein
MKHDINNIVRHPGIFARVHMATNLDTCRQILIDIRGEPYLFMMSQERAYCSRKKRENYVSRLCCDIEWVPEDTSGGQEKLQSPTAPSFSPAPRKRPHWGGTQHPSFCLIQGGQF